MRKARGANQRPSRQMVTRSLRFHRAVGKGSEALDNIRPIWSEIMAAWNPTSRLPRKGERVYLPGVANTFTIFAVRKQSRVVDLQLIDTTTLVMNDVPWDALMYLDEAMGPYE
jgi:hypothetical protein